MKSIKTEKGYFLKLLRGEKAIEKILEFCSKKSIASGVLQGIGGAYDIELGYYNLDNKEYTWKKFYEVHEILSISGNISLVENKPFIHAHVVISNSDFASFGGHLKEATVGATLEIEINLVDAELKRTFDEEIGLNLLNLPEE